MPGGREKAHGSRNPAAGQVVFAWMARRPRSIRWGGRRLASAFLDYGAAGAFAVALPIAMSLDWVRKKSVPPEIAGEAMQGSPSSFVAVRENFGATETTNTCPISLGIKRFRPSETGEAVKPCAPFP